MSRPQRLATFAYVGPYRYLLTICTFNRLAVFADGAAANRALLQFRRTSRQCGFAILAYCMMPDHAHFLVEGTIETSDLQRFVRRAKQASGFEHARTAGNRLWQEGYHERTLRKDEDASAVARYILNNPVAGRPGSQPGELSAHWPRYMDGARAFGIHLTCRN
jgi:putative transposase